MLAHLLMKDYNIILTHLSRKENRLLSTGPVNFHFKGCRVLFFNSNSIEHSVSKQWRPDQTLRSAAADLGLHCSPLSHKKDHRLIWVKRRFLTLSEALFMYFLII